MPRRTLPAGFSAIAETLALQIRADRLPPPTREFKAIPGRAFRIDFAWPPLRVAVEVDGEVHRIRERFHADIEKHALLVLHGWTLLRVGGREVRDGQAIRWITQLIEAKMAGVVSAH